MNEQRPMSMPSQPQRLNPVAPKVIPPQTRPPGEGELTPIGLVDEVGPAEVLPSSKIRFNAGTTLGARQQFKRQPCTDGHGACRVRTFHGRLSDEGLAYMDDKINEWLDSHQEIEVKFVTTAVGLYDGKVKEPALVMNVWY